MYTQSSQTKGVVQEGSLLMDYKSLRASGNNQKNCMCILGARGREGSIHKGGVYSVQGCFRAVCDSSFICKMV